MSKQEKIAEIAMRVGKRDVAPETAESLFDSGYLDSFALTDMVTEIEREFRVSVPDADLTPRRFDTVERIAEYLDTLEG